MPNPNPTGKWKKGCKSPNPKGRAVVPNEVRAFRQAPILPIFERLMEYAVTPLPILEDIMKDDKAVALDKICAVWTLEMAKGNFVAIKEWLDRLFGKVKERIETSTRDSDDQLMRIDPDKIVELLREAHDRPKI